MRGVLALSALLLVGAADPYAGADEKRLVVGEEIDLKPPDGIVMQLVCDKVDELIAVTIGESEIKVKALAPGVTACSLYGQENRDEYEDDQRSGVVEFRRVVKLVISGKK